MFMFEVPRTLGVDLYSGGLQEKRGAAINMHELPWIHLGHLEDEDACAYNEKPEHDCDDLRYARFEALV